jgi:Rgg/GadR/MutR family transcriptional activator
MEMTDKKFGETFRKIRRKKGFKITSFKEVGLSKSTLSRFECGEQSLAVDRFYRGLKMMDVTVCEFMHIYFERGISEFQKIYDELYQAAGNMDFVKINDLHKKTRHPVLKIGIECLILDFNLNMKLSDPKEEILVEFLFENDEWGLFEFALLHLSIAQLSQKKIIAILNQFINEVTDYHKFSQYRFYIIQIILKGAFRLVYFNARNESQNFINEASKLVQPEDLFLLNVMHFVQGYYDWMFHDRKSATDKVSQVIEIFDTLGSRSWKKYFTALQQLYMK